jgi:hypothetical protein
MTLTFRTDLPLLGQLNSVLTNDRESRPIADIKARRADYRIALPLLAITTNDTLLGDLLDRSKVHIDVLFLDGPVRVLAKSSNFVNGSPTSCMDHPE